MKIAHREDGQGDGISKNASGDIDLYLVGRKTCQASRIAEGRILAIYAGECPAANHNIPEYFSDQKLMRRFFNGIWTSINPWG